MKRFLIIVLTALCCVAMAACSGGKTPDNPTIVPDSVLLADREVTVYVGGTYKFEPTGAASFTYSSSDDGIAKVTADGVLIGRPVVPFIYAEGAEGFRVYMDRIVSQLRDTMNMCGTPTLADIGEDNIFIAK